MSKRRTVPQQALPTHFARRSAKRASFSQQGESRYDDLCLTDMFSAQSTKTWSVHDLKAVKPLTPVQNDMFRAWFEGHHICAHGSAGTGKSYVGLYLALTEVLRETSPVERVVIVRSAVTTRDQGFLPGTQEEKNEPFEAPYRDILADLCGRPNTYVDMKRAGVVTFMTSAHVRGLTWDDSVVVLDEFQNMTFSELDSVVTRLGKNSRLILCGDTKHQIDIGGKETSGASAVLQIVRNLGDVEEVIFTHHDIVRSGFVKRWITVRDQLGL